MNKNFKLKQGGFINGALIIGIALMAVVVGAIAMASSSSTTDIAAQKTKTTASVGMKKMADAVEAFQIKAAEDGVSTAEAASASWLPVVPKGFQDTPAAAAYDSATGHISVAGVNTDVCAAVNKTLNFTAAATLGTAKEGCLTDGSYVRAVKG
jgi:hypothetical protein